MFKFLNKLIVKVCPKSCLNLRRFLFFFVYNYFCFTKQIKKPYNLFLTMLLTMHCKCIGVYFYYNILTTWFLEQRKKQKVHLIIDISYILSLWRCFGITAKIKKKTCSWAMITVKGCYFNSQLFTLNFRIMQIKLRFG